MIYYSWKGTGDSLEVEGFRLNKAVNTSSLLLPGRLETEELKYAFALYNV
jgi:hypothetical protein